MLRLVLLLAFICCAIQAQTVLVVPFFNHSQSASLDWIGESIAESMHDSLASEGVLALDREDRLEAYRRLSLRPGVEITRASIIRLAQSLDASIAIYGQYELKPAEDGQSKGSLSVVARIMDLKSTTQGPPFSDSGPLEELAVLEARLGWQALSTLWPKTAISREEFLKARPPVRLDAVESYVRGLLSATPEQRHRFFTQAARLDENYSQPCFQLGKIYWEQKEYRVAAGWLQRVKRTDPHYREARFFLGLCRYYSAELEASEEAFREVSEAMPLNEVQNNLAAAQSRLNYNSAAIANFRKAIEGDSADPDYHFNLGYALWRAGQFEEAVESFRAAAERDPSDTEVTSFLGLSLSRQGPRPGDPKSDGRQRLKTNYDEAAYRQLQAELSK